MEYDQKSRLNETVSELPKWVKLLFRLYAVIFLLFTLVAGTKIVYSVSNIGRDLLHTVSGAVPSISSSLMIALFLFALAILVLEIIYGIGVYKFKRWTLPLVLIFSFNALLVGFISLLNLNFSGIVDLTGLLLVMVLVSLIGFAAIKYWSMFTGSARKLVVQIPLLLVLAPLILFTTLAQIFPDDKQINDSDLLLHPVDVLPQSKNAHYFLPKIEDLSPQQKQAYEAALKYESEAGIINLNKQEAINLVNQTMDVTDAVIEASSKSGYQCPTLVNNYSFDAEVCSLSDIRDMGLLTAFRANVEADTGNKERAIETAVSVVRLGGLVVNQEQPTVIEYLVGIALMHIGLESLERTLSSSMSTSATTSEQVILTGISNLEQSKSSIAGIRSAVKREYMFSKTMTKPYAQYSNYFYQHKKTTNQLAEVFRMGVAISSQGCGADTKKEQQEVNKLVEEIRMSTIKWPIISPNFIGKSINSISVVSLNNSVQKGCEVNEFNERIQVLLQSSS